MTTDTPALRRSYRVLIVLPPDFDAPEDNRAHRFPPQAAALVAASIAVDGIVCRVADLDHELNTRPFENGPRLLEDHDRLHRHLSNKADDEYVALGEEMIARIAELADINVDAFALSIDRHTQVAVSLLLGAELKRRFGKPIMLGGANAKVALHQSLQFSLRGIDFITTAETPHEVRTCFAALRDLPQRRWEVAGEPLAKTQPTPPDDWPVPDFSVYDLDRYRRDPFRVEHLYGAYDGSVGRHLVLPYHFSWDCQYACTFCGRGGTQSAKSIDRAVRDLATLAERFECGSFMLFDAQINLFANDLAKGLIDAGVNIHWTDSFRVSPRRPKDVLETMARSGCIGLTFGVESVSDRMLKRMVKGHTAAQATAIVEDAHALGLFVRVNLLPCFPGENREDHETTVRWVHEYARSIDEVVPSSFYLATNSPVLKLTERYGITVRGVRHMEGDYKFRKNYGSLEYDEIDGYTWEERAATLQPAEVELFESWRAGRADLPEIRQATQVFAVRSAYTTKAACYDAVRRWREAVVEITDPIPDVPAPPPQSFDAEPFIEAHAETNTHVSAAELPALDRVPEPPALPTLPRKSLRALAFAAVTRVAALRQLSTTLTAADDWQLSIRLTDAQQHEVVLCIERAHDRARYYKRIDRLGLWYTGEHDDGGTAPRWIAPVISAIAKLLQLPTLRGLADELSERALDADDPRTTERETSPAAVPRPSAFRIYSVFDLVRQGLKPAAALSVDSSARARQLSEGLAANALSRLGFARDAHDNLVVVDNPESFASSSAAPVQRMLYVAADQAAADRLRDIEEGLYTNRDTRPPAAIQALHEQLGVALGFPSCCAAAFARSCREHNPHADYYGSLTRLRWHLRSVDWRLNHVIARHYHLPFLIHVPCDASCQPTVDLVDAALHSMLYSDGERQILQAVLRQGAVVYPDDRFVLFRPRGMANGVGEVAVTSFNHVAHPEVMGARPAERSVAADVGEGFDDADVEQIRIRNDQVEVFARHAWRSYVPPTASQDASPILLIPQPHGSESDHVASHLSAAG